MTAWASDKLCRRSNPAVLRSLGIAVPRGPQECVTPGGMSFWMTVRLPTMVLDATMRAARSCVTGDAMARCQPAASSSGPWGNERCVVKRLPPTKSTRHRRITTSHWPTTIAIALLTSGVEAKEHHCSQEPMSVVNCSRTLKPGDTLRVRCFEAAALVPTDFVVDPQASLLRFCETKVTKVTDTCSSATLLPLEIPGTSSEGEQSNFLISTHKQTMRDSLAGGSRTLYAVCGQNAASAMSLEIKFEAQALPLAVSSLTSVMALGSYLAGLTF